MKMILMMRRMMMKMRMNKCCVFEAFEYNIMFQFP